jgi:hypothetical protein
MDTYGRYTENPKEPPLSAIGNVLGDPLKYQRFGQPCGELPHPLPIERTFKRTLPVGFRLYSHRQNEQALQ